MNASTSFDLPSYLERIGYGGSRAATLAVLEEVHELHLGAIPFENLDVRLGHPIRLDLESLQAKLVASRRGGYCFEQNMLFAAALRALGFEVSTLEARVRPPGATRVLPRTHMVLQVSAAGVDWLADVGFGGDGPLRPVRFDGTSSEQPGGGYRVLVEGAHRVLQRRAGGGWLDLYAFGLEPVLPVDYEVANYFTSTHPESIFVQKITVQLSRPDARHILRGATYTLRRNGSEEIHELDPSGIVVLLREEIGIAISEGEIRRALGAE